MIGKTLDRRLVPDILLVLVVLAYAAPLVGAADPAPGGWALLAWAQYLLVVALAALVFRAGAADPSLRTGRLRLVAGGALAVLACSLLAHRHDPYFWDATTTAARATLVREGQGLVGGRERFSLFYHFIALLQAIGGPSAQVARLGAAAVGAAGLAGVGLLAGRHGGRAAGLGAAVLAGSVPALFAMLHWLYIDMVLLAVCVGLLLLCDRAWSRPRRGLTAGCLVLAAAALLTKEYAVLVLPVGLGLGWVHGATGLAPGRRRRLALAVAAVAALAIGWGLWRFYLHFWRGLFQAGEPSWEYWPLLIVPGHPYLPWADQLRIALDLARQHGAQLAGTGLLGLALLGLVEVVPGRRAAAWLMLATAAGLAAWPHFEVTPAHLNRLWYWSPALDRVVVLVPAGLLVLRLAGWVRLRITRWQWLLLGGVGCSVLFFACVAKLTRIDGQVVGSLDWRYPLFSLVFTAILAGESVARLLALGRTLGRTGSALAALAPALLVTANFVAGTDYVRQAAAFTGDQQRGVEAAIALAGARQVPVLTNWPYYYPEVPRSLDYGPFRWRTEGIALEFLAFHDFGVPSDRIALFDTRTGRDFVPQAERAGVRSFRSEPVYLAPLRPGVRRLPAPTVLLVDLAAPWSLPSLVPHREEFAVPDPAAGAARWTGLEACEVWAEGLTMRWSGADTAGVRLGTAPAADCLVQLRARAFAGVPRQTVDLVINGTGLGPLALAADWQVVTWRVPAGLIRTAGPNALALVPRAAARPAAQPGAASADTRELGIGLDWLQIGALPADR